MVTHTADTYSEHLSRIDESTYNVYLEKSGYIEDIKKQIY